MSVRCARDDDSDTVVVDVEWRGDHIGVKGERVRLLLEESAVLLVGIVADADVASVVVDASSPGKFSVDCEWVEERLLDAVVNESKGNGVDEDG
ncbi:hypothetical protein FB645_004416 [Coemansia sp. IMI 203386]|nr:hypothetical protein FB645_004416 [Coemansia sp. IMI 203386]